MDVIDLISEKKIKRYFRATRKLNAPGLISHITQRAAGKDLLYLEESDYVFFLWLLKEISRNYAVKVFAFCLLPNHIHLLLKPTNENLSDSMRDLFSRYALRFNRKYERKGHLFGGPYRQAVCLDDSYLLAASLYIHLNPVKSGLSADPVGYRWSSSRLYYDIDAPKSFVESDFILSLLSGEGPDRKNNYRLLLNKGKALDCAEVLEQGDAMEDFHSKFVSLFPSILRRIGKGSRVATSSGLRMPGIEDIERKIEALKDSHLPGRPETRKAKKYVIEQLIARGYKQGEIAEKLGVSRKTVYNILQSRLQD